MKSFQVPKISFSENSSNSLYEEEVLIRGKEIERFLNGKRNELPTIPHNNTNQDDLSARVGSISAFLPRLFNAFGLGKAFLGTMEKTNFSGGVIKRESFYKIDLSKSEFHYDVFEEVNFTLAGLSDIRFSGNFYDKCKFKDTVFQHSKLLGLFTRCTFENINGETNSSFIRGTFIECKFNNVSLDTFCFAGSRFINCQFNKVKITRTRELGPPCIQTDPLGFDAFSKNHLIKSVGNDNWLSNWDFKNSEVGSN